MTDLCIHLGRDATAFGGVSRVNLQIATTLAERFGVVSEPERADLQICSFAGPAPEDPRRLWIDHGSFADAGFWTYTAPRLSVDDTILVSSRVCMEIADRIFGNRRPSLVHVPYFADTTVFHPVPDRRAVRDKLATEGRVPACGPLLLSVAAYSRRKNLHLTIRLLHAMSESAPDARLLLVGRAAPSQMDYLKELQELAATLGVSDRVHFLEPMPHERLQELMSASDLLVHLTTCRLENFGLVVAEALACGLPVLAADWGGLRDLVDHGKNGFLAPTHLTTEGPRVDWLGALEPALALCGDPGLRERMSQNARSFAREHLAVASFETRLCDAVRSTLGQPSAGGGLAALSPKGEDLMFATLQLHRKATITQTSAEYRELLRYEEPLARFLTGPAASCVEPPRVTGDDRLYPLVAYEVSADSEIRVSDPAWPACGPASPEECRVARLSDGTRSLQEIGEADLVVAAQRLVDRGLLAPRRRWADYLS